MRILPALTLLVALLTTTVQAEPAAPEAAPQIDSLDWGVFCALNSMDRAPAPGTRAGWIHVPTGQIAFHWPARQIVPAQLGIAFGVRIIGKDGWASTLGEARVWRPGSDQPETWGSDISAMGATMAFFRFDTPDELIPGLWAIEGWQGNEQLYRVEFQVVPAEALPEIAEACGATS